MRAPAIPPALARRLDRLAARAHRFHRFAHHPLCGEYADEVFRLGRRVRVCRGCALAAFGAIAGALASALVSPNPLAAALALAAAVILAAPPLRRLGKLATRLAPSALAVFAIAAPARAPNFESASLAAAGVIAVAAFVGTYRRRGPDRSPCRSCPESVSVRPCRGFAEIVSRERALQRASRVWLSRAGL